MIDSLPRPDYSGAVIIGGAEYGRLPALPGVRANLTHLADYLCGLTGWDLPGDRCEVVFNPYSPAEILDPIRRLGADSPDMLLVYFAGHGVLYEDDRLHIALQQTATDRSYTAMPYELIRSEIIRASTARKVAILDCCYSGNVIQVMSTEPTAIAKRATIAGACVITATRAYETALAPEGERFTLFTGELIDTLRHGVPAAGPDLSLRVIYDQLCAALRERVVQQPQMLDLNNIASKPFAPNNSHSADSRHTDPRNQTTRESTKTRRHPRAERPIAAQPIVFLGVPYQDPAQLLDAMTRNWGEARRYVTWGDEGANLDNWIRTDVRDLKVPVNLLTGPPPNECQADRRIVWLAAHFAPDAPPRFRGTLADTMSLVQACRSAENGNDSAQQFLTALDEPLLRQLAKHSCRRHETCRDVAGCRLLDLLAQSIESAWPTEELIRVLEAVPVTAREETGGKRLHRGGREHAYEEQVASIARVHYIHALLDLDYLRLIAGTISAKQAIAMPRWWRAIVEHASELPRIARMAALAVAMATCAVAERHVIEAHMEREKRLQEHRKRKIRRRIKVASYIVVAIVTTTVTLLAIFGPHWFREKLELIACISVVVIAFSAA